MTKPKLYGAIAVVAGAVGVIFIVSQLFSSVRRSNQFATSSGMMSDSFGLSAGGGMMQGALGIGAPEMANKMMPPEPWPGQGSVAVDVPLEDRLIIKTGSVSLLVDDVPVAIQSIQKYANDSKGFVVSSNVDKLNLGYVGYVTFRIPSEKFDTALTTLASIGEVKSQQVNGQDVTEEFVDVEAQLKNLQATEAQYLDIMRRAQKIEDVLAVQRELSNVRSQIDQLDGRKKYLSQSAAMSTITVNLSTNPENLPVVDKEPSWKPLAVFKSAVRSLINVAKGLIDILIVFVVFIPVWAALGLIGFGLYRWLKRRIS